MRVVALLIASILLTIQGCAVFVPAESFEQKSSDTCQLETKSMTLEMKELSKQAPMISCESAACLIVPLVLPVGSFIVSGSIVLANNTLH